MPYSRVEKLNFACVDYDARQTIILIEKAKQFDDDFHYFKASENAFSLIFSNSQKFEQFLSAISWQNYQEISNNGTKIINNL